MVRPKLSHGFADQSATARSKAAAAAAVMYAATMPSHCLVSLSALSVFIFVTFYKYFLPSSIFLDGFISVRVCTP